MSGINQAAAAVIAGFAASGGAVLVVAGAGKLYRGVRGFEDSTAIRRVLRMPARPWRLFGLAAGLAEGTAGVVVCSGRFPVPAGAALAGFGAVFCALLGYVRIRKVPGGCGCIGWRAASRHEEQVPGWPAVVRGALLLGAGVAYAVAGAGAGAGSGAGAGVTGVGLAGGGQYGWFGGGVAAGIAVLVLLSVPGPVRTPMCRRPLWRRTSATLRALAGHETFAAMAGSAGPFGPMVRYRRLGCTDEFWFTVPPGQGGQAVVFQVRRVPPGARLAVHTSLRDITAPSANMPARVIAHR